MSTTLTATQSTSLEAAAEKAALTSLETSASSASATSGTTTGSTSAAAIGSLTTNYSDFLDMLTTQLKDQDPTSPMTSDNFTSELVQFAGVEQQITTNSNLSSLISLSQDQQLSQSSDLVGKSVTVNGSTVPLQNSAAKINYATSSAEPIGIAITNSGGQVVKTVSGTSAAGNNTFTWDGTDNNGNKLPDGPYTVAVQTMDSTGTTSAVPFTSTATPTAIQKSGSGFNVSFGATTLDLSSVESLAGS